MRTLQLIVIVTCLLLSLRSNAQSNDHIFPAADVAKKYIDFDGQGFIINGKKTFLVSAGLEYARIPRALWKDRLQRLKMAGFNCIEIYTFWNYHEPQEGKFNFTGEHDLNAFLQLVHSMGMYCIARVGPYYCAEWDFGGYPTWLRFKKGLEVREPNAVFQACVDHFFDTLMPIIVRNQINHGGAVIMVQLENEHSLGWGTAMPNPYFEHLRSYALLKGMQVPYFFSGLHHASDPAGDDYKLDDALRHNPWFSTEFWSVWYNGYRSGNKEAKTYARRTWKIIAGGGGGYNYYMAHGGSNFGYTNNDEDAASYDYGAAVGEGGDLRPIYYAMKEAALFARSFEDILANAHEGASQYSSLVKDTSIRVSVRASNYGNIIFLDNQSQVQKQVTILNKTISLESGGIYPLVHNYPLTDAIAIDWSFTRIYSLFKQNNTANIILSGEANDTAAIDFIIKRNAVVIGKDKAFHKENNKLSLRSVIISSNQPSIHSFHCGNQTIRIICVQQKEADNTWFYKDDKQAYIVCGPRYVSDIQEKNGQVVVASEEPWRSDTSTAWLFTNRKMIKLQAEKKSISHPSSLPLSAWQYKEAIQPAAKGFDDGNWLQSKNPSQMGADGDTTADAWYRTTVIIPEDSIYTFQSDGNGRAMAYIDGEKAAAWNMQDGATTMNFTKGKHTLAVFTAHDGRDKLAAYIGAVDSTDSKGLFGDARLIKGIRSPIPLNGWKYKLAKNKEEVKSGIPKDTSSWQPYTIGQDVFDHKKGFAWFTTTLSIAQYKTGKVILFFKSVDENATVFINNQQVAKHEGWNQKFYVTLEHLDTVKAPLVLNVFIENYDNEGGIDQPVTISVIPDDAIQLTDWRMKGGTGEEWSNTWSALKDTVEHQGPVFYQSHFMMDKRALQGMVWRIATTGLGHGSVWVNGYNLGRYPEKTPVPGIYVPECWLREGDNTLVVYDEDGKTPQRVALQTEELASRDIIQLTVPLSTIK